MKHKFSVSLTLALVLAMLVTSLVVADDVVTDGDIVNTGNQPSVNLGTVAPGATLTPKVSFTLTCSGNKHVDDAQTATMTYSSSGSNAPAGGSIDDATTATIGAVSSAWPDDGSNCPSTPPVPLADNGDSTVTLTAPTTPGTYTYKINYGVALSPPGGNDSASVAGSTFVQFTLTVDAPANTPPSVSVTGVTNGISYEFGSVPDAVCEVTDTEDGNSSFAATLSAITGPLSAYGLGSQTASCAYTDGGGLSATPASATYTIVDTSAPDVSCGSADGFWHATDVSIPCTASDNVALATPADASFSLVTSVTAGTEDSNASTNSYDVYDVAGNYATAGPISGNMVDKKAPTNINFVGGGITNGGSYYFGFVPAGPSGCTADDGGSGLSSCNVTGGGTSVGAQSYLATATDNVGNYDTATMSYTVLAWTLKGFYAPVDMGIHNLVKGGATVPLKFEVFAGDTELTDTSIVQAFTQKIACVAGLGDNIETYATGETSLRYDTVGGQFVFNWKTLKSPGACYRVTMKTLDGSSIFADFTLK
jgi:hypothetical protein